MALVISECSAYMILPRLNIHEYSIGGLETATPEAHKLFLGYIGKVARAGRLSRRF